MTAPGTGQTLNAAEAERAVVSLEKIMDQLEQTVTEETARVRAGRLRDAMNLFLASENLAPEKFVGPAAPIVSG